MSSQVASYAVDAEMVARFEIEPTHDWFEVTSDQAPGDPRGRVRYLVEHTKAFLARNAGG